MPRYILTGTPGAGKTAVLRLLELHGHLVVEESATDVIAVERALGHEDPWQDPSFVDKVVILQRRRLAGVLEASTQPVFFDRSPVCTLALCRYLGSVPSQVLMDEVDRTVHEHVYEPTVFFVRNLGFVHPTVARQISFEESLAFERIHQQIYRDLGFDLVEVPAGPLVDRVALIRQTIEQIRVDQNEAHTPAEKTHNGQ